MTIPRTVALVGAGGFGSLWAEALRRTRLRLVAVVDPDEGTRTAALRRYGLPAARGYAGDDVRYLAETGPDLVIDSAPPGGRHDRMTAALAAGAHVLAAKPATSTAALAAAVADTADEHGRLVMVAMQKRYNPAFGSLLALCRSGALGRIGHVGVDVSVDGLLWEPGSAWRRRLTLPSLRDGGSHHIDLVRLIVGDEVETVTGAAWNPSFSPFDREADYAATLGFSGGATAHLVTRWSRRRGPVRHYFSGLEVEGEQGAAWVENGVLHTDGVPADTPEEPPVLDLAEMNARMLPDVLADMAAGKSEHRLDLADHAHTLSVVEAVQDSVRRGTRQTVRYAARSPKA
jgi:predicted dehydrogenase